ncbi:hypothetical protein PG989_006919 [Apiospora arundinis]
MVLFTLATTQFFARGRKGGGSSQLRLLGNSLRRLVALANHIGRWIKGVVGLQPHIAKDPSHCQQCVLSK